MTASIRPIHQGWTVEPVGGSGVGREGLSAIPATVPGTVHTDLLAAAAIVDPYLDRNEQLVQWIGRTDWQYRTSFDWHADGPDSAGHDRVELVCEGLDTVATVTLNGVELGTTRNMHRSYRFDVTGAVVEGANELVVRFDSAYNYAVSEQMRLGDRPSAYRGRAVPLHPQDGVQLRLGLGSDADHVRHLASDRPAQLDLGPAGRRTTAGHRGWHGRPGRPGQSTWPARRRTGRGVGQRGRRIGPGHRGRRPGTAEPRASTTCAAGTRAARANRPLRPGGHARRARRHRARHLVAADRLSQRRARHRTRRRRFAVPAGDQRRADLDPRRQLDPRRLLPEPDHPGPAGRTARPGASRPTSTTSGSGAAGSTSPTTSTTWPTNSACWSGRTSCSRARPTPRRSRCAPRCWPRPSRTSPGSARIPAWSPGPATTRTSGVMQDWGWIEALDGKTWGAGYYYDLLPDVLSRLDPTRPVLARQPVLGPPGAVSERSRPRLDAHLGRLEHDRLRPLPRLRAPAGGRVRLSGAADVRHAQRRPSTTSRSRRTRREWPRTRRPRTATPSCGADCRPTCPNPATSTTGTTTPSSTRLARSRSGWNTSAPTSPPAWAASSGSSTTAGR